MLWFLAHRASDLVRLSLHGRAYTPEGVVLPCKGLAKQTKQGNEKSLQPVLISSFEDKELCPVACLQAYERATAAFRTDESAAQLFLAMVPPTSIFCKVLKDILGEGRVGSRFYCSFD